MTEHVPVRFKRAELHTVSGRAICRLMRACRITIRQAAAILQIPMRTVRRRRAEGVSGVVYCWEWTTYLPQQHAALQAVAGIVPP